MSYTGKDGKFRKGNPGKPKGAISEKTAIWNEISDWFKGDGLEAYQEELMTMRESSPAEFLKRYETMLEYFAPKLSRTEFDGTIKNEDTIDYSKLSDKALDEILKAKS